MTIFISLEHILFDKSFFFTKNKNVKIKKYLSNKEQQGFA